MSYLYRRHRASTHRQLYNDNDHVGLKDSELKNGKGGVHDIGRDKKYP